MTEDRGSVGDVIPVGARGGPRTHEGIQRCRFNALRHGLRAVETVVPGEDPDAWEAHRAALVDDLAPIGALETALAEQVAAKLWRLGRVRVGRRVGVDLICGRRVRPRTRGRWRAPRGGRAG